MATVSRLLWMSPEGYPQSIAASDQVLADGLWAFQAAQTDFSGNVTIAGNLDVGGDIISRDQVNVVIQDSFLDLGFGNTGSTSTSGGFTVQMNRSASFVAGNVTTFNSSSSFTYDDASGSTPLAGGDIVTITGLPASLSANEGFFVVSNVSGASFPQLVTIATTATASVPFAQTAFTAASFPATVTPNGQAFKSDISVLAVADGTTSFKNGAGSAFAKGTFVQAYVASATVSAFQANGAYNVIGATTLQQAYDSSTTPATIATAASKALRFTLNSTGPFEVQGSAGSTGDINFGGVGLNSLNSFAVGVNGTLNLNSQNGTINLGNVSSTAAINLGSAGARIITIGQGVNTGPTLIINGVANSTTLEGFGSLAIGTGYTNTETIILGSAAGGSLGYQRTIYIGDLGNSSSSVNIYGGSSSGVNVNGPINLSSTSYALNITSSSGAITIDGTSNGTINVGTGVGTGSITVGNATVARTIAIQNGVAGSINIGNDASSTGTVNIVGSSATGARSVNVATGGTGAKTLTMGSLVTTSTTTVQAGATGKMYLDSVNGAVFGSNGATVTPAGTRVINNSGGALSIGTLVFAITTGTQASGLPDVVAASASVSGRQGFTGVVMDTSIANTTTGNIASVPGTIAPVTFVTPPLAGDSQKPVFVSTTSGQATMTPPSTSGQRVFIIGYLTSTTAVSGRYNVQLMPQFVADIS